MWILPFCCHGSPVFLLLSPHHLYGWMPPVWIHSNTEIAFPLMLSSRRGAAEGAETGGNWAEVGKCPWGFPGEEKFGQSGNGSLNFSLSPSRPLPPEPAGGSCLFIPSTFLHPLAPCLCSSPKSWCMAGAAAPAASQSLPPRARTQLP